MTGRIEVLASPDREGRITTNSGTDIYHYAYRYPAGQNGLTCGALVTFQVERGNSEMAVSVSPKEPGESATEVESRPREVRYEGFEQTRNMRTFKFHAWRTGEENQEAIVTVDLALFRKHGVGIQEGPGLCLRLLQAELQEPALNGSMVWTRVLTDKEMLAHLAGRANTSRKRS